MVSRKGSVQDLVAAPFWANASLDPLVANLPCHEVEVALGADDEVTVLSEQAEGTTEQSRPAFRQTLADAGLRPESDWYPATRVVPGEITIRQGRRYQVVRLYPVRVSASGDRIEKAEVLNYELGRKKSSQRRSGTAGVARSYSPTSVLSSGSWYKLGLTKEGIYRLDYSYFQQLGVDPGSINPNTIRIHGNGGGVLPQTAGQFPHDDLVENAIYDSGSSDGTFDSGDYILFYGVGPHTYAYNQSLGRFVHTNNSYSDSSFYFLTWGGANGRRIAGSNPSGGVTHTPTFTRRFNWHESDRFNPLTSGRSWLGETFDLTTQQTFNFPAPGVQAGGNVLVSARVAGRSNYTSSFTVRENTTTYGTLSVPNTSTSSYDAYYYRIRSNTINVPSGNINDGTIDIQLEYNKPDASSVGYLDYIEIEYNSDLNMGGSGIFTFHAIDNTGPGQVFAYNIQGANSGTRVWDVTDPVNVTIPNATLSGSTLSFQANCDTTRRFVAHHGGYLTPASARRISNQNLHALGQADYIMVVNPAFKTAAQRLADFHRSYYSRTVHVVELPQILNEFSSGAMDPSAIRDFVKMFYDRAGGDPEAMPKYLLLVGDGSYDYRGRSSSLSANYVPTYQSRKSSRNTESYTSDDYYGFLDDGEGFWGENSSNEASVVDHLYLAEGDNSVTTHGLDIAVGRLPVSSPAQANAIVDKIIRYKTDPAGFGPWRNRVVLAADHKDGDGSIHVSQADSYSPDITIANPAVNIEKIYMDNYTMESTASGAKFPEGRDALLKALDEGSLLVNYTGHGGEIAWSNATILDIADIKSLTNRDRLPAYITATCEFGRWDDPERVSGAENLFLNENGGAIAMFTTVRVVYSGPNYILNQNFYEYVLSFDSTLGRMPTMGEVFRNTKNDSWLGSINNRNFSLMGDPGMPLAYPTHQAVITKINGVASSPSVVDTISALSLVTIEGEVQDENGQLLSGFTGDLYASVYDKPAQFTTKRAPFTFQWQKNKIFIGEASVVNGRFSFQFVVPVDISYENGYGKISLYAKDASSDAVGNKSNLHVGGTSSSQITDTRGPELELFMNDEKFVDGGMVGPDPLMLADVFDENGLNTVGTGIGHELTAVLDGNEKDVIVLNDYYTATRNSYKNGRISYPFEDLSPGEHTLDVKVWDVANNSSEASIRFLVADDATVALGHVLNYPNPFSTNTQFFIEHNRNGSVLDVQVRIYTVSGRVVKTLRDNFLADGNLYCDMTWDGLDDYGDALGRGVYVYQVTVQDQTVGGTVSKFEKLVVLR